MHLSASDLVSLHRPTLCPLRVYLRSQGVPEAEPGAFDLVLRDLGQQHERAHLATLGPYEDISLAPAEEQEQRTKEAIEKRSPVIYQGRLSGMVQLNGETATIVGRPDFLVLHGDEYLIRDAKLSRRVDEDNHPEISLQLQLYGWLYRNAVGRSAAGLQAYTGKKDIAEVADDGGRAALLELGKLLELRRATDEPYEPLGWTKCAGGCGFYERCWSLAEARQDVSLVMDVDQGLARKLHGEGVISARDLLARYDAKQLSELRRPWGKGEQKVGKKAEKVLI
ncbi:MAG: PD-(D/E)XK nuclease family protein, partial [Terriglobales bacterium]